MVGLFVCFFLIWSCEEKKKWAVVAGVVLGVQVVCAFSVGACENWKLGERFHLKRELCHGMPVVSAWFSWKSWQMFLMLIGFILKLRLLQAW